MVDGDSYSAPEACFMAGVSYRQLDYWSRSNTVCADVAEANGSGSSRRYSIGRVRCLALAGKLSSLGARRKHIARVIKNIEADPELWSAVAVVGPDGAVARRRDWRGDGGWQVDLAAIAAVVDSAREDVRR